MRVKVLNNSGNPLPKYQTEGSAAFDIAVSEDTIVEGSCAVLVSTGLHFAIPRGYEGQLRLRSSMYKRHVVMPNAPGTIDSDYRGEVKIPIRNLDPYTSVHFKAGERIAQMAIVKCPQVILETVSPDVFASSEDYVFLSGRGSGGFGCTGVGIGPSGL